MRKLWMRICLTAAVLAAAWYLPAASQTVLAAWATVQGTVESSTTPELLYLKTAQGQMQIKIDAETNTSQCKILLPGRAVTVGVNTGTDGYLHAESIIGSSASSLITVDKKNTMGVTGTLASGTTVEMLYIKTNGGVIQAKLDDDSDLSGVTVLVIGKNVNVTLGRGSDAYLHVLKVTDGADTQRIVANVPVNGVNTTQVPGTIQSNTKNGTMVLKTSAGTMEIRIDGSTDLTGCKLLVPNRTVTAYIYLGSDAYVHAAKVASTENAQNAASPALSATVKGQIMSGTTADTLYLSTSGGNMTIKLDSSTNMNSVGALYIGSTITVQVGVGTDGFLHAITITY
ncbi:hypothetical protein [Lachnoclostridium sp. Marseille-P6806]|uniref:hypothetical protein n=1 Tax=Lachnoclostridium sp. Marseille-P6806 TaxID=2364793 RepID=UPI00103106F4|nr:hypothetical protein [Lachnoclostridium sp. Marseille-P6806]